MNRILGAAWRPIVFRAAAGLLLLAGTAPCLAAGASRGELVVEGQLIESLTVVNEAGNTRTINRPGASVSLPAGQFNTLTLKQTLNQEVQP